MRVIQCCTIRCVIGPGLGRVDLFSETSVHCQGSVAERMDQWSVSAWLFHIRNTEPHGCSINGIQDHVDPFLWNCNVMCRIQNHCLQSLSYLFCCRGIFYSIMPSKSSLSLSHLCLSLCDCLSVCLSQCVCVCC